MMEKIFVTKPYLPPKAEFDAFAEQIWNEHQLTNYGPLHQRFAEELKQYFNTQQLTLTVNGHLALEIALQGLQIKGEVITTPFTFASTAHAIKRCGCKPVFCDIREDDLTIDADKIEMCITEHTTAILPVHVYGHLCDVEKIETIAKKYNLKVIYDAAHAFGVRKSGVSVANFGDVSMFSFHATKLFHSIEGGALAYQNPDYARLFRAYQNFGIEGEEDVNFVGGNAKMNEFQAAMGLANLPHITDIIAERKAITMRYIENLHGVKGLSYFEPGINKDIEYNYAYMPVLIDEKAFGASRDKVHENLKKNDIYARKYFYPIVTQYACYRESYKEINLPVAQKAGQEILCLPLFNGMDLHNVDSICEKLK